ncbi:hypothetical protein ACM55I_06565 [Flavobacterium sp. GB2R13]|uniref:hypothetical protein n=1 Tax=Flavobacterium algoris TaxID=3398733 RepID=UPI003A86724D
MKNIITHKDFEVAEKRMNDLLNTATQKGGFDFLTPKEHLELEKVSAIVGHYEDEHYPIGSNF